MKTFNKSAMSYSEYYTNIDMAETIKQYYNQFNQIVNHTFNDTNKTSFTETDINSMPKGYAINGIKSMDFNDPSNRMNITHLRDFSNSSITNIYQTPEQMKEAESLYIQSGSLIDGINGHSFGLSLEEIKNVSKGEDWQFNPDMSVYPQNEDGSYSKEALFMSFLKSYSPIPSSNQVVLSPEAKVREAKLELEMKANPSFSVSLDEEK